jgi:thioredoxin-like negative regulator of GroEL
MARSPHESIAEVYARVGEALNTWSQLEDYVLAFYLSCIASRNPEAARAAYQAVVAFEAKLAATDAAAKVALASHSAHLARWKALFKRIDVKRRIRNKLAHAQVLLNKDKNYEARLFPFHSITNPESPVGTAWNGG